MQEVLIKAKKKLQERDNIVKKMGFRSKERVLTDEYINTNLKEAEALSSKVFRTLDDFILRNDRFIPEEEFENRELKLEFLKKNLSLLNQVFEI